MMKYRFINLLIALALQATTNIWASDMYMSEVKVVITTSSDSRCSDKLRDTMEQNLSHLLSEIGLAYLENRTLNLDNLAVDESTKNTLALLWDNFHFCSNGSMVVLPLCEMKNKFVLRKIPLIISNMDGNPTNQECSVYFDEKGRIVDFVFISNTELSYRIKCDSRIMNDDQMYSIVKFLDFFPTAYITKDIRRIESVFNDSTIFITSKVTSVTSPDGNTETNIEYIKENKQQYLNRLKKVFERDKYIDVTFSEINDEDGDESLITRSIVNENLYGVRLYQKWVSSNFSNTGYLFQIWDFTDKSNPQIQLHAWQPEYVGNKKLSENEIFSLSNFHY